jgi:hypothetical protein
LPVIVIILIVKIIFNYKFIYLTIIHLFTETSEADGDNKMMGYVSNVSPVKISGKKKYFSFNIHSKNQTRRAVCFTPDKRLSKQVSCQDRKI